MIIYRTFMREAARNTAAITLVLAIVMAFIGLTALLGRAVRGDLPEDLVMQLLGLETLRRVDLLLTLGLYLGVLLALARWYRDSEMTVLAACGIGLAQLLRPALLVAIAVAMLIAALGFHFTPWAINRMSVAKTVRAQQVQPNAVAPGVFTETVGGKVFYAENIQRESGRFSYVFASGLENGSEGVVVARSGYTHTDDRTGDRFLAFVDGNLYEGAPGDPGYRLLQFERMHVRLDTKPVVEPPPKVDGMTTFELWRRDDPDARAEIHWRMSKPVTAIVLMLFAMVLAHTDPRRGRLANLFVAIFIYVVYSNLLALGQTFLQRGYIPWSVGLWWVHGIMLTIAVFLFVRRAMNRPLFGWFRLRHG